MSTADVAKGKIKEALGSLTGSDDLREEGQAQQPTEVYAVAETPDSEAELFEDEERYRQELLY